MVFIDKLESLIEELNKYKTVEVSPEPSSDGSINNVEQALGVKFPTDYRQFLKKYGTIMIGDHSINGIYEDDPELISGETVLGTTRRLRVNNALPGGLVPVFYDAYVRCRCLDLRGVKEEGPICPVVHYGLKSHDIEKAYDSFSEYIINTLENFIEVYK